MNNDLEKYNVDRWIDLDPDLRTEIQRVSITHYHKYLLRTLRKK